MLNLQSTGDLEFIYMPSLIVPSYIYAIILNLSVEFYTYHILISVTYDQLSYLLKVFFILMVRNPLPYLSFLLYFPQIQEHYNTLLSAFCV